MVNNVISIKMWVMVMIKAIAELKKYNTRLTTVLNELETLEDGFDVDYTDTVTGFRECVLMLEDRRESLQRRGRTQ